MRNLLKAGSARALFGVPVIGDLLPGSGYPDQGRLIVQGAAFKQIMAGYEFSGVCLNAGSGEGLYHKFLTSFPAVTEIVDVDLSQPDNSGTEESNPKHRSVVGSLTSLPFENATFDSCLCSEVIEHIEDDRLAVAELARVMKPGGLLLVSTPSPPAPHDKAHVREGYSLSEMTELLAAAGFTIVRHKYCFHFFMRALLELWGWQFEVIGKEKRNYFPRWAVYGLAYSDMLLQIGPPWDIVVVAIRK